MPNRSALLTFAMACLISSAALADEVDLALEAFHSTCLAQGPDFERTAAAAERRGWQLLSREAVAMLAPVKDINASRGWVAEGHGMPENSILVVTKATLGGRAVQTCSVALFGLDPAAFEKRFFARTDAEKIGEDSDIDRTVRAYSLIAGGRKQLVNLSLPTSTAAGNMIVASSIATKRGGLME